ncbi:MAG: hypothetical protein WBQ73_01460 [Candidatus Babeliales bacterium]
MKKMKVLNKKLYLLLCAILLYVASMAFFLNGAYLSRMGSMGPRLERIGQRRLASWRNQRFNPQFLKDYHAGRRGYSSWNRAYVPKPRWLLGAAGLGGVYYGGSGLEETYRDKREPEIYDRSLWFDDLVKKFQKQKILPEIVSLNRFIKNELKTPRLYKPGDERSSIK